MTAFSFTPG
jgi:hypothetical protein